jgi:hypothetical protein
MSPFFRTYRKSILASILGAVAGYLYYALIGCTSGGCMISSSPYISSVYGAIMGIVAVGFPESKKIKTTTNNE